MMGPQVKPFYHSSEVFGRPATEKGLPSCELPSSMAHGDVENVTAIREAVNGAAVELIGNIERNRPPNMSDDLESGGEMKFASARSSFWKASAWNSHSAPASPVPQGPRTHSSSNEVDRNINFSLTPRPSQNNKGRPSLPPLQPLSITRRSLEEWSKGGVEEGGGWTPPARTPPPTPGRRRDNKIKNGLEIKLDLGALNRSRDASEPSELQLKRDKFAYFDKECSRVAEHIYLGSDAVARNRETLRANKITHVLNCVGFLCHEYFPDDLSYKTLWLQDSPCEDITSILYDVFDYFEEVREHGGRVFVHCCQGVSRSTSLVIAYLMWREGRSFEDAFQDVKAARGVTNPNMGFACQLLQCQKRVHAAPASPNSVLRMYRMAPHSPYDPLHLVPKTVNNPGASALDSRGAFVVHVPNAIFVWQGHVVDPGMTEAAQGAACQVVRYERAQGRIVHVREGDEPSDFWDALKSGQPEVDDRKGKPLMNGNSGTANEDKEKGNGKHEGKCSSGDRRVDNYDNDFDLFRKGKQGIVAVAPIPGAGAQAPPRDSGWGRLRCRFFSGPGGKPCGSFNERMEQSKSDVTENSRGPGGKDSFEGVPQIEAGVPAVSCSPITSPDPSLCPSSPPFS